MTGFVSSKAVGGRQCHKHYQDCAYDGFEEANPGALCLIRSMIRCAISRIILILCQVTIALIWVFDKAKPLLAGGHRIRSIEAVRTP